MSDETPDDREQRGEPAEHHGVVETLREEIEEVVEHVPQPVRWTVGKLVRVGLLSIAALIVLVIVSAALYLPIGTISGMELVANSRAGPDAHATIEQLSWEHGPWDSKLERFAADYRRVGEETRLQLKELRTDDVDLRGDLRWKAGSDVKRFHG